MRKILIACVALALGFAAAGSAMAGEAASPQGQIGTFQVSQTPPVKSTATGASTTVRIQTTLDRTDGSVPSAVQQLRLSFPRGMKVNTKAFPKCDVKRLLARGPRACPKGSRVGGGTVTADAYPVLPSVSARVRAYNGKNRTLLMYAQPTASSPVAVEFDIRQRPAGAFGGQFSWSDNVALIQTPAPITSGDIQIGAVLRTKRGRNRGVRKIPYLTNPKRCRDGALPWQWFNRFYNGESLTIDDAVPCGR